MQVKVFKFDKNGKISFTQAELEKLLNEVYTGGYNDGKRSNNYWTWTSPYWTWSNSNDYINTISTTAIPSPKITWTTNSDTVTMDTSNYTTGSINGSTVDAVIKRY